VAAVVVRQVILLEMEGKATIMETMALRAVDRASVAMLEQTPVVEVVVTEDGNLLPEEMVAQVSLSSYGKSVRIRMLVMAGQRPSNGMDWTPKHHTHGMHELQTVM